MSKKKKKKKKCVCILALVVRHANRILTASYYLSSVASLVLSYFSTFSHKQHDFRWGESLDIKGVFSMSVQLLSQTFLILRMIQRDIIISVHWSSCRVPVIFVRFPSNLRFLNTLSKYPQISNFIKIRQVGPELFHANGRTDGHTSRS